jgi:hypothetical protein
MDASGYTPLIVVWELVFMLVILKIPVVYLCAVVWWAIKAEPEVEGGGATEDAAPEPWRPWHSRRRQSGPRPRRGGPHGSPARSYARTAGARAEVKR